MRYNKNGVYMGTEGSFIDGYSFSSEWRTEPGYNPYTSDEITVGDVIVHGGIEKRVTAIRGAVDPNGYFGYICLLEDGSQKFFKHYGTPRHSGRYPWGSGKNPYQRNADFLGRVYKLKQEKGPDGKALFSEKQIADSMGMTTTELRKRISLANSENWNYRYSEFKRLKDKGMSTSAIARRMGESESTLRSWEKQNTADRMTKPMQNAKVLKDRLEEVPYIQVGAGAEYFLNNATQVSLQATLKQLENEGYTVHNIRLDQLGKGKKTTVKVLAKPGVEDRDIYKNIDKIALPTDIQMIDGKFEKMKPFVSVDPKRVQVRYAEQGGAEKDGLIEVRPGVPDLALGKNHYVQGRILVDGDHYLKGMITYADDELPPGVDIRFNTNKHEGTPMINREDKDNSVLKPIKKNQENIFGANIKPDEKLIRVSRDYIDENGEKKQSAINIVKEEGDVDDWNRTLPSQFLSKQNPKFAESQLKTLRDVRQSELDEIMSYNNPIVQMKMLDEFAGKCDRDSVHLAAAALPRQKTKFILPLDNVADNEAYCPGFNDGEQVALVRFPHGSISEIPIVTVNNANKKAKKIYGDSLDAIGISHAVAEQLSGADFDGDTVLVLPTNQVKIAHKKQFKDLKNWDHLDIYKGYEGLPEMTDRQKGLQMGIVSNLITDMTIKGASDEELVRALKHSMVVIDAQKHHLDWKRSELENGIPDLQKKYQKAGGGASTFLSRSTSEEHIQERELKRPSRMSPEERARWKNGEEIYRDTGRKLRQMPEYLVSRMTKEEKADWKSGDPEKMEAIRKRMHEDGRERVQYKGATVEVKKGYLHDPYELTSTGDRDNAQTIERIYADHARAMKDMATEARRLARNLDVPKADPQARIKYRRELDSLDLKLAKAQRNAPLERQAIAIMNARYKKWKTDHPNEDDEHKKREKSRLLDQARKQVGAKKHQIGSEQNQLTEREWEAIQNRAVSPTKLKKILDNCDMRVVKRYALPKAKNGLAPAQISRAKMLLSRGYTRLEVCDALDISESTLINAIGKANV